MGHPEANPEARLYRSSCEAALPANEEGEPGIGGILPELMVKAHQEPASLGSERLSVLWRERAAGLEPKPVPRNTEVNPTGSKSGE